jgi:hypothetical protein
MIKLVLVCEVADADTKEEAQLALDDFREAVRPSMNYGLTLYRATEADADAAIYAAPGPSGWEEG